MRKLTNRAGQDFLSTLGIKVIFILLLSLVSCQKNEDPENILRSFIKKRFSKNVDFEELTSFFVQDLKKEYENSREEVEKLFKKKFIFKYLKVRHKEFNNDTASITYSLAYKDDKVDSITVVKKIALFRKENKSWKIYDIQNIKTNLTILEKLNVNE